MPLICGWVRSTPESTTATVTPAPLLIGQAERKFNRCCGHGVPFVADPVVGGEVHPLC
jgi:hypothetical protein